MHISKDTNGNAVLHKGVSTARGATLFEMSYMTKNNYGRPWPEQKERQIMRDSGTGFLLGSEGGSLAKRCEGSV